jgi:hypothetical protein
MLSIGDLVYLKRDVVDVMMWWSLSKTPCIVLSVVRSNVVRISIEGKQLTVLEEWLIKHNTEDICIK